MALCRTFLRSFFLSGILFLICSTLRAQTDTIPKEPEAHKNFFNQMINNFRKKDTTEVDATYELKRNDEAYNQFANMNHQEYFDKENSIWCRVCRFCKRDLKTS